MMNWKRSATFGALAASLAFSSAVFADQPTNKGNAGASTNSSTSTTTSVTSDVYTPDTGKASDQFQKVEAKIEQFQNQQVPTQALQGKLGAVENHLAAVSGQLDQAQITQLQQQLDTLQGDQAKTVADTLQSLYTQAGDLQSAIQVEKEYVQKKLDKKAKDEDILKEYKQLGKLIRKAGKTSVTALVNGEEPNMDVQPTIENGRTLLPFRALAESLGAQVSYDQATRTVTVTKGDIKVVLTIDSVNATVNGQSYTLDVPAQVVQGRTLIPLRFLGQSLNARVLWDQDNQVAIVIGDQNNTTATGETSVTQSVYTEPSTETVPSVN